MTKELWINLPVRDVRRAGEFFSQIGFVRNERHSAPEMDCFKVGEKNMTVLLVAEETFKGFSRAEISDTKAGAEVLISLDAESREEVDEKARRVLEAGGSVFGEPAEIQGWMYGFGFADLDGHRWNVVYMDFGRLSERRQQQQQQ